MKTPNSDDNPQVTDFGKLLRELQLRLNEKMGKLTRGDRSEGSQGKHVGTRLQTFAPPMMTTQPPSPKIVVIDLWEDDKYQGSLPDDGEVKHAEGLAIAAHLTATRKVQS